MGGIAKLRAGPVACYGFDPACPGFFWFAGQGGFGIQTAPAAAQLAARMVRGENAGEIDPAPFRPGRFA